MGCPLSAEKGGSGKKAGGGKSGRRVIIQSTDRRILEEDSMPPLEISKPVCIQFLRPKMKGLEAVQEAFVKVAIPFRRTFKFMQADAILNSETAYQLKLFTLPAYVIFKDHQAVARYEGSDMEELQKLLKKHELKEEAMGVFPTPTLLPSQPSVKKKKNKKKKKKNKKKSKKKHNLD